MLELEKLCFKIKPPLHPLPFDLQTAPVKLCTLPVRLRFPKARHESVVLLLLLGREDLKDADASALEETPATDHLIGCCVVVDREEDGRAPPKDILKVVTLSADLLKKTYDSLVKESWIPLLCEGMGGRKTQSE
jgi:hypothetical protein